MLSPSINSFDKANRQRVSVCACKYTIFLGSWYSLKKNLYAKYFYLSCAFKYLDLKKKIKQGGVVRDSYINTN